MNETICIFQLKNGKKARITFITASLVMSRRHDWYFLA